MKPPDAAGIECLRWLIDFHLTTASRSVLRVNFEMQPSNSKLDLILIIWR